LLRAVNVEDAVLVNPLLPVAKPVLLVYCCKLVLLVVTAVDSSQKIEKLDA
jgi:hypothetical protein